jgi:hypothetical protein
MELCHFVVVVPLINRTNLPPITDFDRGYNRQNKGDLRHYFPPILQPELLEETARFYGCYLHPISPENKANLYPDFAIPPRLYARK